MKDKQTRNEILNIAFMASWCEEQNEKKLVFRIFEGFSSAQPDSVFGTIFCIAWCLERDLQMSHQNQAYPPQSSRWIWKVDMVDMSKSSGWIWKTVTWWIWLKLPVDMKRRVRWIWPKFKSGGYGGYGGYEGNREMTRFPVEILLYKTFPSKRNSIPGWENSRFARFETRWRSLLSFTRWIWTTVDMVDMRWIWWIWWIWNERWIWIWSSSPPPKFAEASKVDMVDMDDWCDIWRSRAQWVTLTPISYNSTDAD